MKKFPFEKSKADKEHKGKGKEGSKKEQAYDKKQQFPGMKKGGCVKKMATGGMVMRGTGCATKGKKFSGDGCD